MNEQPSDALRSWNERIIQEFRANGGQVGGRFQGAPLLLMTTQGRATGRPHTNPVTYQRDGARYLVFASNAGGPTNPDWYHNLLAHPQVTIEVGTEAGTVRPYATRAVPLGGDERDQAWERQCALDPAFRDYERQTTRTIPVVALQPVDLAGNPQVRRAMGEQLIVAHDTLRAQLADIRSGIDALLARGREPDSPSTATATAPSSRAEREQLHRSCLSYCYGLQLHHIREDGGFSALEDHLPELTPALDRLRADHHVVEKALADFEAFLAQGPPADRADVEALRRAVEDAVAGLDDHFADEEQHLLPAVGVTRPSPTTTAGR
jgi:deazaflavin-dependent oxidoreductase (nitroreductase family)